MAVIEIDRFGCRARRLHHREGTRELVVLGCPWSPSVEEAGLRRARREGGREVKREPLIEICIANLGAIVDYE